MLCLFSCPSTTDTLKGEGVTLVIETTPCPPLVTDPDMIDMMWSVTVRQPSAALISANVVEKIIFSGRLVLVQGAFHDHFIEADRQTEDREP